MAQTTQLIRADRLFATVQLELPWDLLPRPTFSEPDSPESARRVDANVGYMGVRPTGCFVACASHDVLVVRKTH